MATVQRPRAVMKINKKDPEAVMSKEKVMNSGIGGNQGLFATPNPPLSALTNQAANVDKAQTLVSTRAPGSVEARDIQLGILVGMMETEMGYVQGIADAAASRAAAIQVIRAAGLDVAGVSSYVKPLLAATQAMPGGPVLLVANAKALGATKHMGRYLNWAYTADGGKTFVALTSTHKARTTVLNLTPLTTYGFRVALADSDGVAGPWSPIVNLLVR